jgi:hypothetical protein
VDARHAVDNRRELAPREDVDGGSRIRSLEVLDQRGRLNEIAQTFELDDEDSQKRAR